MEKNAKTFAISRQLKITCYFLLPFSLLVFGACTWIALTNLTSPTSWESTIFHAINDLPGSLKLWAVIVTTAGGSIWAFVGTMIIATALKAYRLAWWLTVSLFMTYGFVYVAKVLVDRARPAELIPHAIVRATETSGSFPSGHVALATIVSLTVFFYLPKGIRWFVVLLWIGAVAFTRLYLGVHSPLDVLGGVAIAVAVFAGLRLLPESLLAFLKLGDKKAAVTDK